MNLDQYILEKRNVIDNELARILVGDSIADEMARYTILAPSNRWRPIVAIASVEMYDVPIKDILPVACAIEILHGTSIIIDDLPSFDNGMVRRGKPTLHRVYGEHLAHWASLYAGILANFQILSKNNLPQQTRETLLELFCKLTNEMMSGEIMDLDSRTVSMDVNTLLKRDEKKSGALYGFSAVTGGIAGKASDKELNLLNEYGRSMGTAYQILDDILDVEAQLEQIGKDSGKDKKLDRPTLPSVLGLEASKEKAKELMQNAKQALSGLGRNARILYELVDYVALFDKRVTPAIVQFNTINL